MILEQWWSQIALQISANHWRTSLGSWTRQNWHQCGRCHYVSIPYSTEGRRTWGGIPFYQAWPTPTDVTETPSLHRWNHQELQHHSWLEGVLRGDEWGGSNGMATPLGEAVKITTYLDANNANNVVTRRSHTGILITHCPVQQEEKHSRVCYIWSRNGGNENCTRSYCSTAYQTQDVWRANRWTSRLLLWQRKCGQEYEHSYICLSQEAQCCELPYHSWVGLCGNPTGREDSNQGKQIGCFNEDIATFPRNYLLGTVLYWPSEIKEPEEIGPDERKQPSK